MTSVTKIPRDAGKNAHHNDELPDLGDGGQKPEVKNLSDSGWITMSATMDGGAVVTAAQIGRECGVHRTSTTPPMVVHRNAHREFCLSHCMVACSSCLPFQSHRVQISGFHFWWSGIAWPWAPSTTSSCARTTVARTTRLSIGSPSNTWTRHASS